MSGNGWCPDSTPAPARPGPGAHRPDQPGTHRAVRPLFFVRQREIADAAEVLAALIPERDAIAPVVGQAVLMDLAWLCSYLREVATAAVTSDFEPVREAVESFLQENAPEKAPEWLQVFILDEPLRWGFRVRVEPGLADDLSRVLRPVVALGDSIAYSEGRRHGPGEAYLTTLGEIDWAIHQVRGWRGPLAEVRGLVPRPPLPEPRHAP